MAWSRRFEIARPQPFRKALLDRRGIEVDMNVDEHFFICTEANPPARTARVKPPLKSGRA